MEGSTYWIATVSDQGDLFASELIWTEDATAETIDGYLSSESDLRDEASRLGVAIKFHGPFTLPETP